MPTHTEPLLINRRWISSLGFPVLAGALFSIALMFNICSVSREWQDVIDAKTGVSSKHSPAWAVSLKALSLALAVTAHIFFLFTLMISKFNQSKGVIVTALGLLASAAILFALIGIDSQQNPGFERQQPLQYSQSFFYGIMTAGLYILITIILMVYTIRTHAVQASQNHRQRAECIRIILPSITFAAFLIGGAAIYSTIEGWSLADALYFTNYTLFTIGLGNIVPKTHLGRSLLLPYTIAGISALAHVVRSISLFTKEMRNMTLKFKIDEVKTRTDKQGASRWPVKRTFVNYENPSYPVTTNSQFPRGREMLNIQRMKSDFFRRCQHRDFAFSLAAWLILWLVSAAIFHQSEKDQDWTYFLSLYFTFTSLTTIGYGDLYPMSNFGKVFFVLWTLLTLPVLTHLVITTGEIIHRSLAYCSACMWRFGVSKTRLLQDHQHEQFLQPYKERPKSKNLTNQSSLHSESQYSHSEPEIRSQFRSNSRQACGKVSTAGTRSRSAGAKFELTQPLNEFVYQKLLLAEEIEQLIGALGDESMEQNLCCHWSRILPLLHATTDHRRATLMEFEHPTALSDFISSTMINFADPERALSETKIEILYLLTLLVEKLCSDLRKDLYKTN